MNVKVLKHSGASLRPPCGALSIMKLRSTLSLCTVLGLCALTSPAQAQSAEPQWHSDDALEFSKAERFRYNWRNGRATIRGFVTNNSNTTSKGAHRVLVRSWLPLANARYDFESGAYMVNVCRDADSCTIPAGGSIRVPLRVNVPFFLRRWAFFFLQYMSPTGIAQNTPYALNLLHNADMDGTSGALQNVKPFSALVNGLRAQYPENTLLVSSGDNYIPGPRFAASADDSLNSILGLAGEGRGDIAFMNAMGYQASAVGNHDLDSGPLGFLGIFGPESREEGSWAGASFPYLSANLDFSPVPEYAQAISADGQSPADMAGKVGRYTITTINGQRIGIVGATTPALANITNTGDIAISPENAEDMDALAAKIQESVDEVTSQGVNKVIVLAHMQNISIERTLATKLRNVDVIVAGGSNTLLADANDTLREGDTAADTYPLQFNSPTGEPVLVVNTDGDYKYLGRLLASFDLSGKILTDRLDSQVNGAYAATDAVVAALGNPEANPQVCEVADALSGLLAARDGNIVGKSSVYLDGRRGQVRNQETNLGNLTADANLWVAKQYDASVSVSLKNGGGIRDDIGYFAFPPGSTNEADLEFFPTAPNPAANKQAGDISQFDVQGTLRFNNGLTLLTVSGTQLAAILEHGIANATGTRTSGRFPHVAGVQFTFNPAVADADGNVTADGTLATLVAKDADGNDVSLVENGTVTAAAASSTFRLVTLDFLYNNCGDGYPLPTCNNNEVAPEANVDANPVFLQQQALPADAPNRFDFAQAGSEQDALSEYLGEFHSETPFAQAETAPAQDTRIRPVQ